MIVSNECALLFWTRNLFQDNLLISFLTSLDFVIFFPSVVRPSRLTNVYLEILTDVYLDIPQVLNEPEFDLNVNPFYAKIWGSLVKKSIY